MPGTLVPQFPLSFWHWHQAALTAAALKMPDPTSGGAAAEPFWNPAGTLPLGISTPLQVKPELGTPGGDAQPVDSRSLSVLMRLGDGGANGRKADMSPGGAVVSSTSQTESRDKSPPEDPYCHWEDCGQRLATLETLVEVG